MLWPWGLLSRSAGGRNRMSNLLVDRVQLRFGCCLIVEQAGAQTLDRAALPPGRNFLAGAVGIIAHALGVRPSAVGFAFDQGGAGPGTSALDGVGRRLGHSVHVISVQLLSGQAIGRAATG